MSSKATAVSVRGLSKSYTIAHNASHHTTAGEAIMHRLKHPFQRTEKETFWALKDIAFDVQKGDVVGIMGRNGAGKSTLLKILSQITEPTEGEIRLYGRVGSLLEVGTGFHPELTGRENIFLNGAILGMPRREIERQFDAIVAFAEVEQFLDTPVKRYSSGMYVRLAFAVAAHLSSEILIVDEVLAVGDVEFQKKCLGKMQDVAAADGRTVLFVSHNIGAILKMCNKGLLLQKGRSGFYGDVQEAADLYHKAAKRIFKTVEGHDPHIVYDLTRDGPSQGEGTKENEFSITKIEVLDTTGEPKPVLSTGDDFTLRIHYHAERRVPRGCVVLQLTAYDGSKPLYLSTQPDGVLTMNIEVGDHAVECAFQKFPLAAGEYTLGAGLAVPLVEMLCWQDDLSRLTIYASDIYGSGLSPLATRALVAFQHQWKIVA